MGCAGEKLGLRQQADRDPASMIAHAPALGERLAMYNRNTLKLGLFGENCSSGRAATKVPERWPATWEGNLALARMADEAGIDFLLPIGRWKGYGGETNFEGSTWETVTWACGLLAQTQRITVFGTIHAPLVHPVFSAKQFVTADHIGRGRFGVNVVCGWNQDEFDMFGAQQLEHDARYEQGQEWINVIQQLWEREEPFDFDGTYYRLKGLHAQPKPYGGTRPIIMNAGSSPAGRGFALRNGDYLFSPLRAIEQGAQEVTELKRRARELGREVGVFTAGYVVCRPTKREAEEYHRYYAEENGDWGAVDHLVEMGGRFSQSLRPEVYQQLRIRFAGGYGGYPFVGDPDTVAAEMAKVSAAGYTGLAFSLVNYLDEFPFFRAEVLPRLERLGLRVPVA
jgi:alkanesulfonate monooxygenase SsuD/methylene tetrahydromethanopterin reductase-like flavin-dependent oxidoreductase (luciferase family)